MDFHKDEQLVEKLKAGDDEAFNELYQKYYKPLLYTAYRLTNNIEDAKDAVQSAFVQMFTSIKNLKDPKYFCLWMNKIVRGKCIDLFQKNKDVIIDTSQDEIINQYEECNTDFIPHDKIKFTADQEILMKLINELPVRYQEILFYAYFYQFSMQEMSDLLEIPKGTVKSRLHSAKKALKQKIADYESFHHYKITFHVPGAMSISLFLLLHKPFQPVTLKDWHLNKAAKKLMLTSLASASVITLTVLNTAIYKNSFEDVNPAALPSNAQEAYFKLKHWAMDEIQMSEKNAVEILEIEPAYYYLKEQKGAYWERIQADGWDRAFEKLVK